MTFSTHRSGRSFGLAAGLVLAALVAAPGVAVADDLPPAPVQPGFEDVDISQRPLSTPCLPAPTTVPGVAAEAAPKATTKPVAKKAKKVQKATTTKAVKEATAKKAPAKKVAKKTVVKRAH